MSERVSSTALDDLAAVVGPEHVATDAAHVERALRDNSWLSPILHEHFRELRQHTPMEHRVLAVVAPADAAEVEAVVGVAVDHRIPVTVRGGGTSNFGQVIPTAGGIVLDMRRVAGIDTITGSTITALAGTPQGAVEAAARRGGRELTVLTTTFATATIAGWIAGGHVGLGTNTYGSIWDGNVIDVTIVTATEPPSVVTLRGADVEPLLHTYGTTGVITHATMPTVPAHDWSESVASFSTFVQACRFTTALADSDIAHRVAAAQEAPLMPSFRALRPLGLAPGVDGVLVIHDATRHTELAAITAAHGGTVHPWRSATDHGDRPSLAAMVYGHRMLWIKKTHPDAAFLHGYLHPSRWPEQLEQLKQRLRDDVLVELKYMRSPWLRRLRQLPADGLLPATVLTIVRGDRDSLDTVTAHCDDLDITYQNPHSYELEDSGLFPDLTPIRAFKQRVDPHNLLNPGKLTPLAA